MEVAPGPERLDQEGVLGQVRHDPHLDLAVVGGHQRLVPGPDDERLPDPAALLGAHRDVLQVRVGRGQPPGRRDQLVERGVDAPVGGHRLEQPLDGLPQPGHVAVPEQRLEERVLGLHEQRLQRVGVGGVAGLGALGLGHPELVEEHHLELLGRAQVDLLADRGVRRVGRELHLAGEVRLERLELLDVDGDAGALHLREQVHQRQLHVGQQPGAAPLLQLVVERLRQVEHRARLEHRGVTGRVRRRGRRRTAGPRRPAPPP